jgi:hypothetical protein
VIAHIFPLDRALSRGNMDLIETFEQLGANEIGEYIRLGQEEHLRLDFKTVSNASLNKIDDKRNLAKCISGFANSSGGLIVWGVDARKNEQQIDCASTCKEIDPVKLFVSRLNELTGEAVSPIVEGIRHKSIETGSGKGFAVTLVPENDSGPYMAKLGEFRYYKRSGDSFYHMEHFDLEDMFGRRQKPKLRPHVRYASSDNTGGLGYEQLSFYIENCGRAIAQHAGFFAELSNIADHRIKGAGLRNVSAHNDERVTITYDNNVGVFHPNPFHVFVGSIRFQRNDPNKPVSLNIIIYCENMRAETVSIIGSAEPSWVSGPIQRVGGRTRV